MYGDFECPYCRDAIPSLQRVMARMPGRVRLVFRDFPLREAHPHAEAAARAAEAASMQGRFWAMHDKLYDAPKGALEDEDLRRYAGEIGLDLERFDADRASEAAARRVEEDHRGGEDSGVSGTPTFFIDGQRHRGFYDVEGLIDALEDAGA
jgi:protein-disulfide isomerase